MREVYQRKADEQRELATAAYDEAAAEGVEEARAEELLAKGDKHAKLQQRFAEQAKLAEAAELSADVADVRRDQIESKREKRAFDEGATSDKATDADRMPTVEELQTRSAALQEFRKAGFDVRGLDDETAATAFREYPVEELFFEVMRDQRNIKKSGRSAMDEEQLTAWDEYCQRHPLRLVAPQDAKRAIAGGQVVQTAGFGQNMVPETLDMTIIGKLKFAGPLTDFSRIRVYTNDSVGKYVVSTVTDNTEKVARYVGEATDTVLDRVATSQVEFDPNNLAVQVPFSDQMLMSGNVNLRQFIESDVPMWIGRKLNTDFTNGDGSGMTPGGITNITKSATTVRDNAAAAAITEEDVHGLISLLDLAYIRQPGTTAMAHFTTLLYLSRQRASAGAGELIWPRSQDGLTVVLPGGFVVEANNDLGELQGGAAGADLLVLGDLNRYGACRAGGMFTELERELRSFQWLYSWNLYVDGQVLDDSAFVRMEKRS